MDFDIKKHMVLFLKRSQQFPILNRDDIEQEKLIHHTVKVDINELLNSNRKQNFTLIFSVKPQWFIWLWIAAKLAEFILEDSDQGGYEFREIIQDELRRHVKKYMQVKFSLSNPSKS